MLRSLIDLEQYKLSATDGDLGKVVNFFLDDERWTIRYLIAQTGSFFSDRRVLISPISLRQADWSTRQFHAALTRDKVKSSPSIEVDRPVSRQRERDYYGYYGYQRSGRCHGTGREPPLDTGGEGSYPSCRQHPVSCFFAHSTERGALRCSGCTNLSHANGAGLESWA